MGANYASKARRFAVGGMLAALALGGLACGANRVLLDVDVRSFMDEEQLAHPYDSPPLVPLNVRLEPVAIDLVEGFKDFGAAESATMDIGVAYDNTSGTGSATFVLYFSDDPSTVYATPPVATVNADLQPGATTTGALQIQADPRVLDLFTQKDFYMGVDMTWNPASTSVDPLQGTLTITQIHVHLVSTLSIF